MLPLSPQRYSNDSIFKEDEKKVKRLDLSFQCDFTCYIIHLSVLIIGYLAFG